MIGKGTTGTSFGGCDQYLRNKEKSKEIGRSILMSKSPKEIYKEIGTIRRLKPNVKKAIFHASLSLKPGTKLDDVTWSKIGHEYMRKMGFTDNQYLIYRHADTDKDHIHIVANRIKLDGSVVKDSYSRYRTMEIVRGIELKYNLEVLKTDYNKTITAEEYKGMEKTGIAPLKVELQENLKSLTQDKPAMGELIKRLQTEGVYMKFKIRKDESISGLSYITEKGIMKASDVGKAYTFSGLQNRKGVTYDKNRDYAQISKGTELAKIFESNQNDRRIARTDSVDVKRGERYGDIDGRVNSKHNRAPDEITISQQRDGGKTGNVPEFHRDLDWRDGGQIIESKPEEIRVDFSAGNRSIRDNMEHIHDLADMEQEFYQSREKGVSGMGETANIDNGTRKRETDTERLPELVGKKLQHNRKDFGAQIKALNFKEFDVILINVRTKEHKIFKYTDKELISQYRKLKIENAKGFNVAIRSSRENNYVVIDQIPAESIYKLKNDGLAPSLVIENNGKNQAWINLKKDFYSISNEVRAEMQRALKNRYGGVETGINGYVSAVGFRVHTETDLKPITRLVEGVQRIAKDGWQLFRNVIEKLGLQSEEQIHNRRIEEIKKFIDPKENQYNVSGYYKSRFKEEFGNDPVLRQIKKADFTKKIDVFNFQEKTRGPIFRLGTNSEILKNIEMKDYHVKLKNIDLKIAGELVQRDVDPKLILSTFNSISPSLVTEGSRFEKILMKDLGIGRSMGRGFSM